MLVGAAKRHIGESATSCHLELLKKEFGGNCYKLPVRAAKGKFGETATS